MSYVSTGKILAASVVVFVAALLTSCSTPASSSASAPAGSTKPLWGTLEPVVTVKELMKHMIDPIADNVFESVKIVVTAAGTQEIQPRTQEDWDRVQMGGVALAEAAQLLKIPRPFAPAGDENNSTGPDASELSPAQITAKLEKDPVLWNAKVQALRNVGMEVLEIVKQKDAAKLWDAGENLDDACESCHVQYWYPGDPALYVKLDRRLTELYGPRANRTPIGMTPPPKPKSYRDWRLSDLVIGD